MEPLDCAICLDAMNTHCHQNFFECNHKFHFECIADWIGTNIFNGTDSTCPLCRSKLVDQNNTLCLRTSSNNMFIMLLGNGLAFVFSTRPFSENVLVCATNFHDLHILDSSPGHILCLDTQKNPELVYKFVVKLFRSNSIYVNPEDKLVKISNLQELEEIISYLF